MKIVMKDRKLLDRAYFASLGRWGVVDWAWLEKLRAIAGMTLEVETEYLFRDQFNTAPIPGVSESGMRIMGAFVERVVDDARLSRPRCQKCGEFYEETKQRCRHCWDTAEVAQ